MSAVVLQGDCIARMQQLPDNCIDLVVTDPPYGLTPKPPPILEILSCWLAGKPWRATGSGFMGKEWDSSVPGPECWKEVLRVLKPGGHAFVFAGSRTVDLMGMSLRISGFEIRDSLQWLYGSAMPSGNRKGPDGKGTRLKPGHEPILVCRKPFKGRIQDNFEQHGTGYLEIDAARIPGDMSEFYSASGNPRSGKTQNDGSSILGMMGHGFGGDSANPPSPLGRWPANVVMDEEAGALLDEQTGNRPGMSGGGKHLPDAASGMFGKSDSTTTARKDNGGASRFFYCAKTSKKERNAGLEDFPLLSAGKVAGNRKEGSKGLSSPGAGAAGAGRTGGSRNDVPCVKPIALMRWIIRIGAPRPDAICLDPFAGSGSTGCACVLEEVEFLGFEKEEYSVKIANARIAHLTRTPAE